MPVMIFHFRYSPWLQNNFLFLVPLEINQAFYEILHVSYGPFTSYYVKQIVMLPRDPFWNHGIHETSLPIHYSFRLHFIYLLYIDISDKNLFVVHWYFRQKFRKFNSPFWSVKREVGTPLNIGNKFNMKTVSSSIRQIGILKVCPHRASAANIKVNGNVNPSVKWHLWSLPLAARCGLALTILWSNNEFINTPFTTLSWLWFLLHSFLVWVQQRCWNELLHLDQTTIILHWWIWGGCPNSFDFMQFSGKFGKIVWNPGSTTVLKLFEFYVTLVSLGDSLTFYSEPCKKTPQRSV